MSLVVHEKELGRAFPQLAHVFWAFVITPAIGRHRSNSPVNRFEIRLGALDEFFRRQRIDWIERRHTYAKLIGLCATKTDPTRRIEDSFSCQMIRFEQEIAAILFECATAHHNTIQLKPTFALHQLT